ncbi:hypothetical protein JXA32_06700 [Candidatus Sumerlaeota bacterium]|nr:hypothetical protein [Candidatus Sumerlaeota bacterium]
MNERPHKQSDEANGHSPWWMLAALALAGTVFAAGLTQFWEVVDGSQGNASHYALAVPAMLIFLLMLAVNAVCRAFGWHALLRRDALLCALFAMLIAAPLTSRGFWKLAGAYLSTLPRTEDFELLQYVPVGLWPHGADCIATFEPATVTDDAPLRIELLVRNPDDTKSEGGVIPDEPYLLTVELRAKELAPDAYYYCRAFADEAEDESIEVFRSSETSGDFIFKGRYGLKFPVGIRNRITLELGLDGTGELEARGARLVSAGALEALQHGRRSVPANAPDADRLALCTDVERSPERMLSMAGARWLLGGHIPSMWLRPVVAWTVLMLLMSGMLLCFMALLRRQWIDREHCALPMAQIPAELLGLRERGGVIWRSRAMWISFGAALAWRLLCGWHGYNVSVPDAKIYLELDPFFNGAAWGRTWKGEHLPTITFTVTAMFLGLSALMPTEMLAGLLLGFALYRAQYFIGEATGWAVDPDYPRPAQQQLGAFLAYAALALASAIPLRRWLKRSRPADDSMMSRRQTSWLAGLIICVIAMLLWGAWQGVGVRGMLLIAGIALLVGAAAARLRAECGAPFAFFVPVSVFALLPLIGGIDAIGRNASMTLLLTSLIAFSGLFFVVPGLQLELLALGERLRLPAGRLALAAMIGAAGGMLFGGWFFLSSANALGGENLGASWVFRDRSMDFDSFNMALVRAEGNPVSGESASEERLAFAFGAGVTFLLGALRRIFAGFWLHPSGFALGMTPMMEYIWGSVLVAWIVRVAAQRIGGARAIRQGVEPFAIGCVLASFAAHLIFGLISAWLYWRHPEVPRVGMIF